MNDEINLSLRSFGNNLPVKRERTGNPVRFSYIIGFSQLSDMEVFVDPKNEMSETEIHPLCGWE